MGTVVGIESGGRVKVKTKDGYFPVANQLMDALCSIDLNGRQFRLVNTVMRLTYGWQQDMVPFNRSQLSDLSGLSAREVSRLKNSLVKCNIIIDEDKEIGINPYIEDWFVPEKRHNKSVHSHTKSVQVHTKNQEKECAFSHQEVCILTPESVHSHTKPALPSLPLNTIKNNIKNKSEHASPDSDKPKIISHPNSVIQSKDGKKWGTQIDLDSAKFIFDSISGRTMDTKEPNWVGWANELRLMRDIDKRASEHIAALFNFANTHSFWSTVILSPSSLRKNWGKVAAQYNGDRHSGKDSRSIAERIKDTSWADGL